MIASFVDLSSETPEVVRKKEVEVEEPEVVNEVVEETMTSGKTNAVFAETKRTESLFQLMQQDEFDKVGWL